MTPGTWPWFYESTIAAGTFVQACCTASNNVLGMWVRVPPPASPSTTPPTSSNTQRVKLGVYSGSARGAGFEIDTGAGTDCLCPAGYRRTRRARRCTRTTTAAERARWCRLRMGIKSWCMGIYYFASAGTYWFHNRSSRFGSVTVDSHTCTCTRHAYLGHRKDISHSPYSPPAHQSTDPATQVGSYCISQRSPRQPSSQVHVGAAHCMLMNPVAHSPCAPQSYGTAPWHGSSSQLWPT